MATLIENPMIEPKESPQSPVVEVETLIPAEALEKALLDDDDDCIICYQTIYRPARTECGHLACESCMLHWTFTAMDMSAEELALTAGLAVDGIKFKCPTCRTYTQAKFDAKHSAKLQSQYPDEYAARAAEEGTIEADESDEYATQTMVLMFGNSHRKIAPSINPETGKTRTHEWTFFVNSSRQDLIEKVEVILHPTFRENRLKTLTKPPFSTTQKGWGYFTIFAGIQLREGWQWVDEDMAVDSTDDRIKDRLPIQWMLDFRENGGQKNRLVKFRKLKPEKGKDVDVEMEDVPADEEEDLGPLADLMSAAELEQYREMRRFKEAAKRAHAKNQVSDDL